MAVLDQAEADQNEQLFKSWHLLTTVPEIASARRKGAADYKAKVISLLTGSNS